MPLKRETEMGAMWRWETSEVGGDPQPYGYNKSSTLDLSVVVLFLCGPYLHIFRIFTSLSKFSRFSIFVLPFFSFAVST